MIAEVGNENSKDSASAANLSNKNPHLRRFRTSP